MYARVLREGLVQPGDPIRVLPPAAGSVARAHALMERVDTARRGADLARWRAAADAGLAIEFVDDGELAMASSRGLPGPAFNRADGLGGLPNLLPRVLEWFGPAGTPGWLPMDEPPWPGAEPTVAIDSHVAPPEVIASRAAGIRSAPGLEVRPVSGPDQLSDWTELMVAMSDLGGAPADAWRRMIPHLARAAGHLLVLATLDGAPAGVGLVAIRRNVGFLRSASVMPEARGRGIQRALIAARAQLAAEHGADLIAAATSPDGLASVRNLERLGFERVWSRPYYRFDPSAPPGGLALEAEAVEPATGEGEALGGEVARA